MRDFPQELVEKVIDNLDELLERPAPRSKASSQKKLSDYSTVSKRWVNRTQYHHFGSLYFMDQDDMTKWTTTISPDPFGVSRHVRALYWRDIESIDGFKDHFRALINIKEATFDSCRTFYHLDDVQLLGQMGSNLVELTINCATTTAARLTSFLAVLPHLHQFRTDDLWIRFDHTPAVSPDNIPFFKGANNLTLVLERYFPGDLSWFPSTVRFTNLGVGASCIRCDLDRVNGWIASSRETLERFDIHSPEFGSDVDFLPDRVSIPLDLSKCAYLRTLQLPLLSENPGLFADAIASVTSPRLSTIILHVTAIDDVVADPQHWKILEERLCRLAKQFRTSQGEKMLVEVLFNYPDTATLLPQFRNGGLMPNLVEEARVVMNVDEQALKSRAS